MPGNGRGPFEINLPGELAGIFLAEQASRYGNIVGIAEPVGPVRKRQLHGFGDHMGTGRRILCMEALRLIMSSTWYLASSSLRSSSTRLKSRNVSTPPITFPFLSRKSAVEALIGIRLPSAVMIKADLLMTGSPDSMVRRNAQSTSHMLARNTSEQGCPTASCLGTPVISSAARLNEVIRH